MYKKHIEEYIDAHRQEMIDDISLLCRINSEKTAYQEGKPYGEGASRALALALSMAEKYGFSINNYDNYVGTADLNEKEKQLDILAHLDVVPAGSSRKMAALALKADTKSRRKSARHMRLTPHPGQYKPVI